MRTRATLAVRLVTRVTRVDIPKTLSQVSINRTIGPTLVIHLSDQVRLVVL